MTRRTIEVSSFDARLSVKNGQVLVGKGDYVAGQFSPEDVGLLISDTRNSTFSSSTLVEIVNQGGLVVLCGTDHLPAAFVVPINGNQLLNQRMRLQLAMSAPCKKRLWQEIIQAKIRNQAAACPSEKTSIRLHSLASRVKSGDTSNVEA